VTNSSSAWQPPPPIDIAQTLRGLTPERFTQKLQSQLPPAPGVQIWGKVVQVLGTLIEASMPSVQVGELCELITDSSGMAHAGGATLAEVVGFTGTTTLLASLSPLEGVSNQTRVKPLRKQLSVNAGPHLLGAVLNGFGEVEYRAVPQRMDGPQWSIEIPVVRNAPSAFSRPRIIEPMVTGMRAVDAMLTLGVGQRVGVFASAGCGKTTLMASIARGCEADVIVFGLIGERGRELNEFLQHELDEVLVKKTIIVCATSDKTSMERARAASTATAIAEGFREQGMKVLLLIDSLTRFARAQREIGLAAGEPPARGGYTPSVYTMLPRLIERAGTSPKGSITAMYTVLVEGENVSDPIGDEARSLLDGHIVLSRKLAEQNHYPAIDVLASVSRTMSNVADERHLKSASVLRTLMSRYQEMELLIRLGEYKPGADAVSDRAVQERPQHLEFLRQSRRDQDSYADCLAQLHQLGTPL
jgi:ATP synthase in type III secretion protein N